METILKPLTVALLFESDRLACSIFTPLMLGVNEMRCSTFPPGRSEFNLQGKQKWTHKSNVCKGFREINLNDWIILQNVVYSMAWFTTHPTFLRCSVMFCLWTLLHLVILRPFVMLIIFQRIMNKLEQTIWILTWTESCHLLAQPQLQSGHHWLGERTGWWKLLRQYALCWAQWSLYLQPERNKRQKKMNKWKSNNLGSLSL